MLRKRAVCFILCIAVVFTLFGGLQPVFALPDYSVIRVLLSIPSTTSHNLAIDGNYSLNGTALSRTVHTAKIESSNLRLYQGSTLLASVSTSSSIWLMQHAPTPGTNNHVGIYNSRYETTLNYLGNIEIRASSGNIQIINHVYLEEYLCGVVPHEMSNSWPLEALKSQAVTARTYAVNMMAGASSSATYDVNDTSGNQVYKGYNAANDRAIAAVNGTAGQVLKSGSEYVQCYYAASNGGWTDIPQHVWSASNPLKPYHIIQQDTFDTANSYSIQELVVFPKIITQNDVIQYWDYSSGSMIKGPAEKNATVEHYMKISAMDAVRAQGYIAGVTSDIEIVGFGGFRTHTHRGNHGGTGSYNGNDFTGNNPCPVFDFADVTMTVNAWRYATPVDSDGVALGDVNGDGVISITDYTLVRLHILSLRPIPDHMLAAADVNRDGVISITDYTLIRLHILGLRAISGTTADGLVREPVTVSFTIDMRPLETSGSLYQVFYRSLRMLTVEETDTAFTLHRRRYGHGIGMSQRGAQSRANAGHTYDQILAFYYPNTQLITETVNAPVLSPLGAPLPTPEPTPDTTNATVLVSTTLNVRSGPDTSFGSIGTLYNGNRVEVTAEHDTSGVLWYEIVFGSGTGFVHSGFVTRDP